MLFLYHLVDLDIACWNLSKEKIRVAHKLSFIISLNLRSAIFETTRWGTWRIKPRTEAKSTKTRKEKSRYATNNWSNARVNQVYIK